MSKSTCSVDECPRPVYGRGWCNKHWQRWRKHGDPQYVAPPKPRPTCSVSECDRVVDARGMCSMHYKRWKAHGDPGYKASAADRFWKRVEKSSGCWLWDKPIQRHGYGRFRNESGVEEPVHRFSFRLHGGVVAPEQDVDHICGVRHCVNPSHLRVASRKQNLENQTVLRSDNTSGYRGVSPRRGRWTARVHHHGKVYVLGDYDTPEEAGEAARLKRLELFTHNDRDRF